MLYTLIGLVSGIISGLGMGGGTILILILTAFMGVTQHVAQATNLIFFIPTSIAAIIIHFKNKNINKNLIKKIIPMGVLGACIGAYTSSFINANSLKKYYGIFLLLIGMYEIFKLVKNKLKERKEKI